MLSYNLFAYCSNNPVNMADPDGDEAILAFLLISAGILIATDIISGASSQRAEAFLNNPTPRNTLNWLTSGTSDMVLGAINPEKPLSPQHWLDSLGTASFVLGVGHGIRSTGAALKSPKLLNSKTISNPFVNKTPKQINRMFVNKGFELRGPDPMSGIGGYVNPKNGRSYHIDFSNSFNEPPHVDVNRLRGYNGNLGKRKFYIFPE